MARSGSNAILHVVIRANDPEPQQLVHEMARRGGLDFPTQALSENPQLCGSYHVRVELISHKVVQSGYKVLFLLILGCRYRRHVRTTELKHMRAQTQKKQTEGRLRGAIHV